LANATTGLTDTALGVAGQGDNIGDRSRKKHGD
jgi:hypothetical protein